jgi:hypothetical protein
VLVLRKIGAAQCSAAAGYNPPRAKRWQPTASLRPVAESATLLLLPVLPLVVSPGPPRMVWKDGLTSLGGCSCSIGMTMGGPNEEPLGIAVLANSYWTKGQPNIIADNAGIAMLKEISAAI